MESTLLKAKIGDRVKCLYGNSGNKFWGNFLETNPKIEKIEYDQSAGFCKFKLEGDDTWWYENDFQVLTTLPSGSVKIYQRVDKVSKKGWGHVQVLAEGTEYERRIGTFTSFYGVVEFYDEPRFSSFNFIYEGKAYYKSISDKKKQFTDLALIRIAGKFQREVIAQEFKTTV